MVVQYILAVRKGRRDLKDVQKLKAANSGEKPPEDQAKEGDKSDEKENVQIEERQQEGGMETQEPVVGGGEDPSDPQNKYVEVEEYYVKYRNFSYLHCEWKTEDELYKGDKRIAAKLKRFKQKMAHHANIFENVRLHYKIYIMFNSLLQ
jgi:chromodomain-helicase-DNA-binding protein 7